MSKTARSTVRGLFKTHLDNIESLYVPPSSNAMGKLVATFAGWARKKFPRARVIRSRDSVFLGFRLPCAMPWLAYEIRCETNRNGTLCVCVFGLFVAEEPAPRLCGCRTFAYVSSRLLREIAIVDPELFQLVKLAITSP